MNKQTEVSYAEETIVRDEYNKPGQEKFMAETKGNLKLNQINIQSAIPCNNNVLIKAKKRSKVGVLYMPTTEKKADDYEWKKIHSVSTKVAEHQPQMKPGLNCYINLAIIKAIGETPIHIEKDFDGSDVEYFTVGAESIKCVYESN